MRGWLLRHAAAARHARPLPLAEDLRPDGAQVRSFAIACNWCMPEVRNSQRYTKRLMSSSFGRRSLLRLRDIGHLPDSSE